MKLFILLLAFTAAAFTSCTTAYKTGQTPDDVYYSPARPSGGYGEERREQQNDASRNYRNEDRAIRLGINDARWRYLDDSYPNLEFEGKPIKLVHLINHTSRLPFVMPDRPEKSRV